LFLKSSVYNIIIFAHRKSLLIEKLSISGRNATEIPRSLRRSDFKGESQKGSHNIFRERNGFSKIVKNNQAKLIQGNKASKFE